MPVRQIGLFSLLYRRHITYSHHPIPHQFPFPPETPPTTPHPPQPTAPSLKPMNQLNR